MKALLKSVVLCVASIVVGACDLSPDALVGSKASRANYPIGDEALKVDHCDRKVELVSEAACFTEQLDEVVIDIGDIGTHGTAVHYPGPGEQSYGGFSITIGLRDNNRGLELGEVVYRREGSSEEITLQCLRDSFQGALGNNSHNCALIGRKKRTPRGLYILKSIEFTVGTCVQRYETISDKGHCTRNSSTVDLGSSYVRAPGITVHEF